MVKRFFSRPGYLIGIVVLLADAVYAIRRPVLIHLFAETGCACGDYHEEVTGWIVRNPLRDHAPELAASRFLDQLRRGQCSGDTEECRVRAGASRFRLETGCAGRSQRARAAVLQTDGVRCN